MKSISKVPQKKKKIWKFFLYGLLYNLMKIDVYEYAYFSHIIWLY